MGPFSDEKGLMAGGEELRWFYDDEMFRAARDVVKKHKGKVEQATMGPIREIKSRVHPDNANIFFDWLSSKISEFGHKLNQADTAAERGIWRRKIRAYKADAPREGHIGDLDRVTQPTVDDFLAENPKRGIHMVDDPQRLPPERRRALGMREPITDHPGSFRTLEEAEEAASPTVWTVRITPEMRTSIKKKGSTFFEILMGLGAGTAAGRATAAEAMAAHEKSQIRPTSLIDKSKNK